MASIAINRKLWNDEYEWKAQGDEWSSGWGGVRWTQYLAPMAKKLIAVDLSL